MIKMVQNDQKGVKKVVTVSGRCQEAISLTKGVVGLYAMDLALLPVPKPPRYLPKEVFWCYLTCFWVIIFENKQITI